MEFLVVFRVFWTALPVWLPGNPNVCCQLWMVDSPGMTWAIDATNWLVKSEARVTQILVYQQLTSVKPNQKRNLDSWNLYNKIMAKDLYTNEKLWNHVYIPPWKVTFWFWDCCISSTGIARLPDAWNIIMPINIDLSFAGGSSTSWNILKQYNRICKQMLLCSRCPHSTLGCLLFSISQGLGQDDLCAATSGACDWVKKFPIQRTDDWHDPTGTMIVADVLKSFLTYAWKFSTKNITLKQGSLNYHFWRVSNNTKCIANFRKFPQKHCMKFGL